MRETVELCLLAARLLLAAVFFLAGAAKLADPKETATAFRNFGLPRRLAQAGSGLLPAGEIVVAAMLIPVVTAWYGAWAALVLLSLFIAGIGVTLARGRRPDCRCFGQLHSAPVGWSTLLRNAALATIAGWLVSRGRLQAGPSLWEHLAAAGANERRVFLALACLLFLLFLHVVRQGSAAEPEAAIEISAAPQPAQTRDVAPYAADNSTPRRHITGLGLPVGTPAPDFDLPDVAGQKHSLQCLRKQGKDVCVVFSSPYCESCQALMPDLNSWMTEYRDALNIILIVRGTAKENLAKLKGVDLSRVLLQPDFEVAEAYDCTSTPAAVVIGAEGRIVRDLAVGGPAIQQLIASYAKASSVTDQPGNSLTPSAT